MAESSIVNQRLLQLDIRLRTYGARKAILTAVNDTVHWTRWVELGPGLNSIISSTHWSTHCRQLSFCKFADEATGKSNIEPPRDGSTMLHAKKIYVPGVSGQVTLLISNSFDGKKVTEYSIIKEVNKWLDHNFSRRPYVDYILYFTESERRLDIELTPIGKYIHALKDLCGIGMDSDTWSLGDRLSFVVSTTRKRGWYGSGIPVEWIPMLAYGSKGLVFNEGPGSAANLLRRVIRG